MSECVASRLPPPSCIDQRVREAAASRGRESVAFWRQLPPLNRAVSSKHTYTVKHDKKSQQFLLSGMRLKAVFFIKVVY